MHQAEGMTTLLTYVMEKDKGEERKERECLEFEKGKRETTWNSKLAG